MKVLLWSNDFGKINNLKVVGFAIHELNFVVTIWLQAYVQHTYSFFGSPFFQTCLFTIRCASHINLGFVV